MQDEKDNPPLLDMAELERLRWLTLRHRDRRRHSTPGLPGGGRRSALRGQGMELHDVRAYQPGDDIRHMDWRATARSGRPFTKVFTEERGRSLLLVVDRSPSMMFGTRRELKAATAARVAAILAFSALAEREPVAGIVLDTPPRRHPPARTLEEVLALLRSIAAPPPPSSAPPRTPASVVAELPALIGRLAGRGTSVCLISDFAGVCAGHVPLSHYLPPPPSSSPGGGTRLAVRIVDEAEQRLRDTGLLRLVPPHGGAPVVVDTSDAGLRKRYAACMAQQATELDAACRRHRVALLTVTNYGDPLHQLEVLL